MIRVAQNTGDVELVAKSPPLPETVIDRVQHAWGAEEIVVFKSDGHSTMSLVIEQSYPQDQRADVTVTIEPFCGIDMLPRSRRMFVGCAPLRFR